MLGAALAPPAPPVVESRAPRLTILEAMAEEGSRSMERLRITGYEPPYFLAYHVKDLQQEELSGRFGAVFDDTSRHERKLFADVRVGSYTLDSSGRAEISVFMGPEGQ